MAGNRIEKSSKSFSRLTAFDGRRWAASIQFLWLVRRVVKLEFEQTGNQGAGSTPCCPPLDCLPAKAGGAVNGGAYAPFILTVDWLDWLCYFVMFIQLLTKEM